MKSIAILFVILVSVSRGQDVRWSLVPDSCDIIRVYPIETFPPIYPAMERTIAKTLAVADTLAKSMTSDQFRDAIIQISDDSLKLALCKMNEVRQYDPLLFKILFTQKLDQYPSGYSQSYGDVIHTLARERVRRNGDYDDTAQTMLNFAGGVYFVRINSITYRAHTGRRYDFQEEGITTYYWCAKAAVLDKIVGETTHEVYPSQEGEAVEALSITWSAEEGGPSIYDPETPEHFKQCANFLREGRDYIVFLDFPFNRRGDGSWNTSHEVVVRLECLDGFVVNPDEFLNLGTSSPYSEVKGNLIRIFTKLDN